MRHPKPVVNVELSEKNKVLRIIAVVILFVIGVTGITMGIKHALNKDTGWQTVHVVPQERSCARNFILRYNFSGSGAEATVVNQKLQSVYADACVHAYRMFNADESFDNVQNVHYINHHPNEVISVDPILYAAFEKLEGTPWLYLGPAYAHYYNLILGADDALLEQIDPEQSAEAADYLARIAKFAADPASIDLQLLGDNRVMLSVSEEYRAFALQEDVEHFLDFGYMTNAFIIDFLADTITQQGLTDGYLVSTDGYTRNLLSGVPFNFNIFDRVDDLIYPAAVMEYRGPASIVFLKDYPTAESDVNYRFVEERFVHLFVDPVDGVSRTSVENLVCYSYNSGCVDVLLYMLPSFVGSEFSVPEGVYSVWCEDTLICYNDEAISFNDVLASSQRNYRVIRK